MKHITINYLIYVMISVIGFSILKKLGYLYHDPNIAKYALPMMLITAIFVFYLNRPRFSQKNTPGEVSISFMKWTIPLMGLSVILIFSEHIMAGKFSFLLIAQLFLTLLIGFSEECFFRMYIIDHLIEKYHSKVWALIISSIFFGFLHMTNIFGGMEPINAWNQSFNAISVGIIYGLIYIYTNHLWVLVILHAYTDFTLFASQLHTSIFGVIPSIFSDGIMVISTIMIMIHIFKSLKNRAVK